MAADQPTLLCIASYYKGDRFLVRAKDEDFPFCSDRCRKIDLGKWAMGVYKISSPVLDPEVLEDLGGLSGGQGKDSDRE